MFKWISKLFSRKQPSQKQSGLVLVASTRKPRPMPTPTDTCTVENKNGEEVEYECGHRHAERFTVNIFGEPITFTDAGYAIRELCAECFLARLRTGLIRCALCGFPIMPGDPVAVYGNNKKLFKKEWMTTVGEGKDEDKGVIGCLRWDCCPSGGFFSGHWMGDHYVPAFEGGNIADEVFRTGQAVYVDLNDKDKK